MLGITIETQQVAGCTQHPQTDLSHSLFLATAIGRLATNVFVCLRSERCAVKRLFVADYCGAFVSLISVLLTEGGKHCAFDHALEQLHTDR